MSACDPCAPVEQGRLNNSRCDLSFGFAGPPLFLVFSSLFFVFYLLVLCPIVFLSIDSCYLLFHIYFPFLQSTSSIFCRFLTSTSNNLLVRGSGIPSSSTFHEEHYLQLDETLNVHLCCSTPYVPCAPDFIVLSLAVEIFYLFIRLIRVPFQGSLTNFLRSIKNCFPSSMELYASTTKKHMDEFYWCVGGRMTLEEDVVMTLFTSP